MNLKGRDFLKLLDFSSEEILYFIDLAAEVKDRITLEVYFDWEPIFGEKSARTNGLKASVLISSLPTLNCSE